MSMKLIRWKADGYFWGEGGSALVLSTIWAELNSSNYNLLENCWESNPVVLCIRMVATIVQLSPSPAPHYNWPHLLICSKFEVELFWITFPARFRSHVLGCLTGTCKINFNGFVISPVNIKPPKNYKNKRFISVREVTYRARRPTLNPNSFQIFFSLTGIR